MRKINISPNSIIILLIIILIAEFVIIISMSGIWNYFKNPENPSVSFNGDTEYFFISGQNSSIQLNVKSLSLYNNETRFYGVKNITVENVLGETRSINSSMLVIYYSENYPQNFNNVYIEGYFNNLTVTRYLISNWVTLNGSMRNIYIKTNSEKITISEPYVERIFINGQKLTDFNFISFEMDNTSSINPKQGVIKLDAIKPDLTIIGKPSKIYLSNAEGIFGLSDHIFDIRSTDSLDVEIVPEYQASFFSVNNTKISFKGFANSAKLSDKDLIMNDFNYWFEKQPEKINVIAVVISLILMAFSLILTAIASISTYKLALMESKKKKDYRQKLFILNHQIDRSYRIKGSNYTRPREK